MKKEAREELKAKTADELKELVAGYRQEMLEGRITKATEGAAGNIRARQLRREIARCLTLINYKANPELASKGKKPSREARKFAAMKKGVEA